MADEWNARIERIHEGYNDVPLTHCDFSGTAWLMSLAYGCELIKIDGRINAEPLFRDIDELDGFAPPQRIWEYGVYPVIFERLAEFHRRWPHTEFGNSDNQSPNDVATCILHSEAAMMAMFEAPEKLHRLLDMVTTSMLELHRHFEATVPNLACMCPEYWIPYGIHFSDDNAAFLSPATYEEFARPYVERLGEVYGGVHYHCCMGYAQSLDVMAATKGFMCFDPQVDYNPMDKAIDLCEQYGAIWLFNNDPWQKHPERTASDIDTFRRGLDAAADRIGVAACIWGNTRDEAVALAEQVRDLAASLDILAE
ncbi:MAG: hypothetical protein GVY16_08250 [Planctomycetes bacterium]|jgi:hypothetical protein|nr:hypothetical protein [Phycisphaerae bacterium]NBB95718.1 hypothetical protein [Planctomycetota bacterium]